MKNLVDFEQIQITNPLIWWPSAGIDHLPQYVQGFHRFGVPQQARAVSAVPGLHWRVQAIGWWGPEGSGKDLGTQEGIRQGPILPPTIDAPTNSQWMKKTNRNGRKKSWKYLHIWTSSEMCNFAKNVQNKPIRWELHLLHLLLRPLGFANWFGPVLSLWSIRLMCAASFLRIFSTNPASSKISLLIGLIPPPLFVQFNDHFPRSKPSYIDPGCPPSISHSHFHQWKAAIRIAELGVRSPARDGQSYSTKWRERGGKGKERRRRRWRWEICGKWGSEWKEHTEVGTYVEVESNCIKLIDH